MVVPVRWNHPHNRGALLLETRRELVHRVAVIVRVPGLIPHTKDCDLLSRQVNARKVTVKELVPSGAAALLVCTRVPCRRANDQAVAGRDVVGTRVPNVYGLQAGCVGNVARGRLCVSRRGGVEQPSRHARVVAAAWDEQARLAPAHGLRSGEALAPESGGNEGVSGAMWANTERRRGAVERRSAVADSFFEATTPRGWR